MAVNHPAFGTFCEICFTQLTPDVCVVDRDGQKWDVCRGECARQAGITDDAATTMMAACNGQVPPGTADAGESGPERPHSPPR